MGVTALVEAGPSAARRTRPRLGHGSAPRPKPGGRRILLFRQQTSRGKDGRGVLPRRGAGKGRPRQLPAASRDHCPDRSARAPRCGMSRGAGRTHLSGRRGPRTRRARGRRTGRGAAASGRCHCGASSPPVRGGRRRGRGRMAREPGPGLGAGGGGGPGPGAGRGPGPGGAGDGSSGERGAGVGPFSAAGPGRAGLGWAARAAARPVSGAAAE